MLLGRVVTGGPLTGGEVDGGPVIGIVAVGARGAIAVGGGKVSSAVATVYAVTVPLVSTTMTRAPFKVCAISPATPSAVRGMFQTATRSADDTW